MDDLISRSALMKYLRDYKWEFAMGSDFSKAMEMIDAQPTAYDVDAVVEQLEEMKEAPSGCFGTMCSMCQYTESCYEGEKGYKVAIDKAIDIVRNAGKDGAE